MAPDSEPRAEPFADRGEAGRLLAARLAPLAGERPVVLALPRGGVPVAAEVAAALAAPLEILAVRKLATERNPEFGVGALAEDGTCVVDQEAAAVLGLRNGELEAIVSRESAELARRVHAYRGERPLPGLDGRSVIVVDDGVATGLTDTAALRAVRRQRPRHLVLAVPVCAPEALERLAAEADDVVCLLTPRLMRSVSRHYLDFSQVSDQEVLDALEPRANAAA